MKKLIEEILGAKNLVGKILLLLLISSLILIVLLVLLSESAGALVDMTPTLAPDGEEWDATLPAMSDPTKTPRPKPRKTPTPTPTIYITYTPEPYPAPEGDSWLDKLLEDLGVSWR